jgi:hypothetical protein
MQTKRHYIMIGNTSFAFVNLRKIKHFETTLSNKILFLPFSQNLLCYSPLTCKCKSHNTFVNALISPVVSLVFEIFVLHKHGTCVRRNSSSDYWRTYLELRGRKRGGGRLVNN